MNDKAALELFGYNTIGELKGKNVFNFLNILEFQEIDFDTGLPILNTSGLSRCSGLCRF